jgi:hypothetical protein
MTKYGPVLAGQFAEEFVFVHAVLEGLAAVDEDNGDFIVIEAAKFVVGVHIDFLPLETSVALEFDEAFFDDLAQVAAFA